MILEGCGYTWDSNGLSHIRHNTHHARSAIHPRLPKNVARTHTVMSYNVQLIFPKSLWTMRWVRLSGFKINRLCGCTLRCIGQFKSMKPSTHLSFRSTFHRSPMKTGVFFLLVFFSSRGVSWVKLIGGILKYSGCQRETQLFYYRYTNGTQLVRIPS